MKKLTSLLPLFALILLISCGETNPTTQNDSGIDRGFNQQIDSLMAIMTLDEKVGQLNLYNGPWDFTGPVPEDNNAQANLDNIKNGLVGGMLNVTSAEATMEAQRLAVEETRLGIPLIFGYDVIHGYKTMFPVPLAQAASWNPEVAQKGAEIAAKEAASAGLHWTFAPMVDIARDARWGRIMEGAGEDPYLASIMSKAWVEGFQGDDLSSELTIAACVKHFAAYGFAEGGRDYNTVDMGDHTLYNVVLPPFKAALEADVATVMNSFNEINGVPLTANTRLQRNLLKDEWGFDGFVVSDWGTIGELITHGVAEDARHAAQLAIEAGCDMDMESRMYESDLKKLVEEGVVDIKFVDDAVRRILGVKYRLGLFDDPYKYSDTERQKQNLFTAEHKEIARKAGRESIVLLKNENNILPLSKEIKSVAVIGSLAESKDIPLGSWRAQAVTNSATSILEGIQNVLGEDKVEFTTGYTLTDSVRTFIYPLNFVGKDESDFDNAIKLAKTNDLVILALGEDCYQTGEARSQTDITLKGSQQELFDKLLEVNKNIVVVLQNGRPLAIPEVMKGAAAVVEAWFLGQDAGTAVADVLFGDYNPSGKLPVSFPYVSGQEPLYYNIKNTGRPVTNDWDAGLVFWSHYEDSKHSALVPFGYGLSYTTFEYSDLKVIAGEKEIQVEVTLTNTGDRDGKETAQVYIRDLVASVTRPIRELKDYQQVELKAGEAKTLQFVLTEEDLGFFHSDRSFSMEPGKFNIMVGGNSMDVLQAEVEVN